MTLSNYKLSSPFLRIYCVGKVSDKFEEVRIKVLNN